MMFQLFPKQFITLISHQMIMASIIEIYNVHHLLKFARYSFNKSKLSLIFSRTISKNNPNYDRDKGMMSKVKRTSYQNTFHNPGDRKSTVER